MSRTTFYLAGDYERRVPLKERAEDLQARFCWDNNSTWLYGLHDANEPSWFQNYARQDLNDIRDSDLFILCHALRPTMRGGKFIELGWALAHNKPVYLVFDVKEKQQEEMEALLASAVFYALPSIRTFSSWDEFHDLMYLHRNSKKAPFSK